MKKYRILENGLGCYKIEVAEGHHKFKPICYPLARTVIIIFPSLKDAHEYIEKLKEEDKTAVLQNSWKTVEYGDL